MYSKIMDASAGDSDLSTNKVVLVGDEGVGKTSMFLRFKTDKFIETTTQTRYQAEHMKEWHVQGTPVKLTLYDTAGMERYTSTIPPTYFRDAQYVLLVYSIDSEDSISNIHTWAECFSFHRMGESVHDINAVLVGNKTDMESARAVSSARAKEIALVLGVPENKIFEISTRTGDGFDALFDSLALSMNKSPRPRRKTIRAGIDEEGTTSKKDRKRICSACN